MCRIIELFTHVICKFICTFVNGEIKAYPIVYNWTFLAWDSWYRQAQTTIKLSLAYNHLNWGVHLHKSSLFTCNMCILSCYDWWRPVPTVTPFKAISLVALASRLHLIVNEAYLHCARSLVKQQINKDLVEIYFRPQP